MAGLRGNQGWVAAAKQASQGTAATVATGTTQKNALAGGGLHPVRETDRLAETDSSRDRGNSFATTGGVEGSPEFYAREASLALWLTGVLGTNVDGSGLGLAIVLEIVTQHNALITIEDADLPGHPESPGTQVTVRFVGMGLPDML